MLFSPIGTGGNIIDEVDIKSSIGSIELATLGKYESPSF